jgi:hypothetical protein
MLPSSHFQDRPVNKLHNAKGGLILLLGNDYENLDAPIFSIECI